jgi:chemotaxis response regulator CheB
MHKTKVYIVDDSLTIRAMMETLIARQTDMDVCGIAADAETALRDIPYYLPDIILLDLNLPGMDGLAFLEEISGHWHHMDVIVVSSAAKQGAPVCDEAFARGAIACFDKARVIASSRELIELLHEVRDGKIYPARHLGNAVTLPAMRA